MSSPLGVLLLLALSGVAITLAAHWLSRSNRSKRTGLGSLGWVMLFLSSGRMPPPPPQSQIEAEVGEKKNREISRQDP
ncbi:MAG TPA: hypothetical protein VKB34_22950 [Povalibacter sp.]|nr:hypothetical protein [Povalibacter sp.]